MAAQSRRSSRWIEFNDSLEDSPEIINEEPYSKGWIIKLKVSNIKDCDELLSPDQYSDLIGG